MDLIDYIILNRKLRENMQGQRSPTIKHNLTNILSSPRKNSSDEGNRKIELGNGCRKLGTNGKQKLNLSKSQKCHINRSVKDIVKDLHLNIRLGSTKSAEKLLFSVRKSIYRRKDSTSKNQNTLSIRHNSKFSKNKLNTSQSKLAVEERSTIISALLSSNGAKVQKLKEDRKKHEEGKNCRIIIIQGNQEIENFIQVGKMGDIMNYLKAEYPRVCYYKSVPSQLTLDYLLMEEKISGIFLNGQSLYLKPCGKMTSVDEKQPIHLGSFEVLKMIGSGGFSKVFLCRFKEDGKFYAMKVIDKQVIVKNKKKKIIMNERNIMKESQHPFLIEMKFAFQSQKHLVFIMEYCPGGQLFGLIKKYKRISQDIARFYIIEIFLGLSYLHQNNVVYRDIKPQNILLGQDGHVKIADLGLAKPDMFEGELAYSFCGSPEYMSPQMILQVGHTYPVDYYCMGALLYELLIGLPPFYSRDTNEIYEAVLSQDLPFPSDIPLSSECKSLLRGLLCKEAKQRLGSMHGVKQILAHPWFGKNSYKNFLQKTIQPPVTFDSVGKINLDRQNQEKNKKEVDEVIKFQKSQSRKFKNVMNNFYYDYRGLTLSSRNSQKENRLSKIKVGRSSSRRNYEGQSKSSSKMMRKLSRQQSQKQLGRALQNSAIR